MSPAATPLDERFPIGQAVHLHLESIGLQPGIVTDARPFWIDVKTSDHPRIRVMQKALDNGSIRVELASGNARWAQRLREELAPTKAPKPFWKKLSHLFVKA